MNVCRELEGSKDNDGMAFDFYLIRFTNTRELDIVPSTSATMLHYNSIPLIVKRVFVGVWMEGLQYVWYPKSFKNEQDRKRKVMEKFLPNYKKGFKRHAVEFLYGSGA